MLATNHVLFGGLLGSRLKSPAAAFALGFASHFALDMLPHWGRFSEEVFNTVAPIDGIVGLGVIASAGACSPRTLLPVWAGMAGAVAPDLNKVGEWFFDRSPFPAALDRFHTEIQWESRSYWPVEVAGAALMGSLLYLSLRKRPGSAQAVPLEV